MRQKPTASSKSWPGVRIVTATGSAARPGPWTRISIGSSVTSRSGRSISRPSSIALHPHRGHRSAGRGGHGARLPGRPDTPSRRVVGCVDVHEGARRRRRRARGRRSSPSSSARSDRSPAASSSRARASAPPSTGRRPAAATPPASTGTTVPHPGMRRDRARRGRSAKRRSQARRTHRTGRCDSAAAPGDQRGERPGAGRVLVHASAGRCSPDRPRAPGRTPTRGPARHGRRAARRRARASPWRSPCAGSRRR